jgi:hypothetical protein
MPVSTTSTTTLAAAVARVATEQFERFKGLKESNPVLCRQIRKYWESVPAIFRSCTSNDDPWSAVFVSFCMREAGATREQFRFAVNHTAFAHQAIRNASNPNAVRGVRIADERPEVGDIIHNNRDGGRLTFEDVRRSGEGKSHSAIVVEIVNDQRGHFAVTVGGNESNGIRTNDIELTPDGFIKQQGRRFICLMKTPGSGSGFGAGEEEEMRGLQIKANNHDQLWLYAGGQRRPLTRFEEVEELVNKGLLDPRPAVELHPDVIAQIPVMNGVLVG